VKLSKKLEMGHVPMPGLILLPAITSATEAFCCFACRNLNSNRRRDDDDKLHPTKKIEKEDFGSENVNSQVESREIPHSDEDNEGQAGSLFPAN
jgi:hypothetical protein